MARPHNRAGSSGRLCESDLCDDTDSKNEVRRKKDMEKGTSCSDQVSDCFHNTANSIFPSSKLSSEDRWLGVDRAQHCLIIGIFKLVLASIAFFSLFGSLKWMLSISKTSSNYLLLDGYWAVQEKLMSDLSDIQELTLGSLRLQEVEFCSKAYENYVPCFNASATIKGSKLDHQCKPGSRSNCLVPTPKNYRLPLRWPAGRDVIWYSNVKISAQEVLRSGTLTKRLMMLEEDQISFRSDSLMFDGVEDYSHQIADMIGLRSVSDFNQAGIRTVLDIGCGYGSFGAHLFSRNMLTMCIANYEPSGSQVQLTLERGLPAMIAFFSSKRLPFPPLSFDMLHCSRCGIDWDQQDGIFLTEADRLLRPGGYFVWTSPIASVRRSVEDKKNQKKWELLQKFAQNLCWDMLSQQEDTVIWKKTANRNCYALRKDRSSLPVCKKSYDVESLQYQSLHPCIDGTYSKRWIPIEQRSLWPSSATLNSSEVNIYGVSMELCSSDSLKWKSAIQEYWSLLSPLIFSDHPKRPTDEDPSPPFNMLRNVMDMNAELGGFNHALLEAGKIVWVMNVVPTIAHDTLPLILDRGFIGTSHNWCEAFPSYPRSYDMVHADRLLSLETNQHPKCTMIDLFIEIDRLLRPEGWVIFRDTPSMIDSARVLATRLKWEARIVENESNNDERILICQKPFPGDKFNHAI